MGHKSVYFSLKFHNSIFQNNHKIRRKSHRIGRPTVTIITWYFHRYYYKWFLQVSLRITQQLPGMGQVYQVNTHDWVQKVCKIFAMMEAIWRDTGEQFDTLICTPELPPASSACARIMVCSQACATVWTHGCWQRLLLMFLFKEQIE